MNGRREGYREGGTEGRREGDREGGREGGREGKREGGRKEGKNINLVLIPVYLAATAVDSLHPSCVDVGRTPVDTRPREIGISCV